MLVMSSSAATGPQYSSDHKYIEQIQPCVRAWFPLISLHVPLLSPIHDWERGVFPAQARLCSSAAANSAFAKSSLQCNIHDVVFLEAMRPLPGRIDTYEVFFGGSDAVIGSGVVQVSAL
jgi:hypothetical protein